MDERLGERIPLIAPIGTASVAGAPEQVVARWLAGVIDPERVASYWRRLDSVRSLGVEITLAGPDAGELERLRDSLAEYAAGWLTPAQQRAVDAELGRAPCSPEEVGLDDDVPVDVGFVIAPVHDREGDVAMLLQLGQLPRSARGATITGWVAELTATVALVEQDLAREPGPGTWPGNLARDPGRGRLEKYRRWSAGTAGRPA